MHYGGSERKASLAAGLNENGIGSILHNPNKLPTLETLDKLATAFQWDLTTVIYWALDRPVPALENLPPLEAVAQVLARVGYTETDRMFILDLIQRTARVPTPNSASP